MKDKTQNGGQHENVVEWRLRRDMQEHQSRTGDIGKRKEIKK